MNEVKWRDLAIQFDGHRMEAISLLKMIINDAPDDKYLSVRNFLKAAPLSGEDVLRNRIEEIAENIHQQLTATTNSLTNILKSAGIEADTVQAGVMELVSKLAELEQKKILLEQGCENSPLLHEMLDWKERAEAAELKLADHNALRADGVQIAINNLKALDASPYAIHSLECKLYELRAGNAGKDGSHE